GEDDDDAVFPHYPPEPASQCGRNNGSPGANLDSYLDVGKCFKGGLVYAGLTRWDESGGILSWATNREFWKTRFQNPNNPSTSANPDDLETTCVTAIMGSYNEGGGAAGHPGCAYAVDGAFVLNCQYQNYPGANFSFLTPCWTLVNKLLKTGMKTESCAEYFARRQHTADLVPVGGESQEDAYARGVYTHSRFGFKFVKCPNRHWGPP
ncbi:MAG: hypothetical protein NT079_00600, partial [Candidatus Omnitrophica bacterium]|nr:hypothetical protein [Candidatus Omnitrophota bacterium]